MCLEYTLFAGCSFTAGVGLDGGRESPNLWVNQLHQRFLPFSKTKILNIARGGRANAGIFQDAVFNIVSHNVKYAVVAWTSTPRYEFELGAELYDTRCYFIPNGPLRDHNLNNIRYSKKYLENVRDRFLCLINQHYEILNLLYYVNSLIILCKKLNTKIFFVNALCEWDQDYFKELNNVLPNQYTKFTQNLLNVTTRSDEEIFKIYKKIHTEYKIAGGINENLWLNLYNSLDSLTIDKGNDNEHPGIKSNLIYTNTLINSLRHYTDIV
jgi:hypothetical protein